MSKKIEIASFLSIVNKSSMKISNYEINNENAPFIIAEMSGNHNQSIDRALKHIQPTL